MKTPITIIARTAAALAVFSTLLSTNASAQTAVDTAFKPGGKFSMQFFADYDYMLSADTATGGVNAGNIQGSPKLGVSQSGHIPVGKTYYVPVDQLISTGQEFVDQRVFSQFAIGPV